MNVTFGTCGGNFNGAAQAWIDFNADGVFDASESIFLGTGNPGNAPWNAPVPITFTVPKTALNGTVNMRVIQIEFGSLPINPCNTFTWGSAIDFSIDISGGACGPASGLTVVSADATCDYLGLTSEQLTGISIYPNPVSAILTLSSSNNEELLVEVLDVNGRSVLELSDKLTFGTEVLIDMEAFEKRVYMISLSNLNTRNVYRVIKN